ncbi:kinase-like protein [Lojkania enalia]|uniref:Kinase-like protein n=1 Tax=Lojkania enalia TaxID=147567 RepID=A0A9P4KAU7_9PLEO|nr:kinase-like protein [Didymosphaeria enalia]
MFVSENQAEGNLELTQTATADSTDILLGEKNSIIKEGDLREPFASYSTPPDTRESGDLARNGVKQDSRDIYKPKPYRFGNYILSPTTWKGRAKVKPAWEKDSGNQCAIKFYWRSMNNEPMNYLQNIYREVSILRGLRHPNIVQLLEMVETERHIGIVTQYCSGERLEDVFRRHRYLKDPTARPIFGQLIGGISYLHKKGIVHFNITPTNVLIGYDERVLICGFGSANTFDPSSENHDVLNKESTLFEISIPYTAPEVVLANKFNSMADIWSCGVVLYKLLAGSIPFEEDLSLPSTHAWTQSELYHRFMVNTHLTFPEYVTPHARDLLRRMLVPDPMKRATFLNEIMTHSWISGPAHLVCG